MFCSEFLEQVLVNVCLLGAQTPDVGGIIRGIAVFFVQACLFFRWGHAEPFSRIRDVFQEVAQIIPIWIAVSHETRVGNMVGTAQQPDCESYVTVFSFHSNYFRVRIPNITFQVAGCLLRNRRRSLLQANRNDPSGNPRKEFSFLPASTTGSPCETKVSEAPEYISKGLTTYPGLISSVDLPPVCGVFLLRFSPFARGDSLCVQNLRA